MKKLLCVLFVLLLVLSVNAGYADKKATDTVFIGEFTRLTMKRYLTMTKYMAVKDAADMSYNGTGEYSIDGTVIGTGYTAFLTENLAVNYAFLDYVYGNEKASDVSTMRMLYCKAMISALESTDLSDKSAKNMASLGLTFMDDAEESAQKIMNRISAYLKTTSNFQKIKKGEECYICSENYDYYLIYMKDTGDITVVAKAR